MGTHTEAQINFKGLGSHPYPGRGIIIGKSPSGKHTHAAYFLTARSEPSKNRIIVKDGNELRVVPADPSKPYGDKALTTYTALVVSRRKPLCHSILNFVVSNGRHTESIARIENSFLEGLEGYSYEPDSSHTPRIAGAYRFDAPGGKGIVEIGIIRKSTTGDGLDRDVYQRQNLPPGLGLGIWTYAGNGDPVPSFKGAPLLLPIPEDGEEMLQMYWGQLVGEYRISIAVVTFEIDSCIFECRITNRFEQVSAAV